MSLNILINKIERKICFLKEEMSNLSYTTDYKEELRNLEPGFISMPYESDFCNKNDFKRYYEIEGEIEVLTFLKEEVFELTLNGGFADTYDNFVGEEEELSDVPKYMRLGNINALLSLNDLF